MGLEHVRSNACSGHPPVSGGVFGAVKPAATGSFVCLGLVSSLRSIRIRVVLTDDWHFARNLAGLRKLAQLFDRGRAEPIEFGVG